MGNKRIKSKIEKKSIKKIGGKMKNKNYLFILFCFTSLLIIINGCSEKKTTEPNQAPTVSITSGPSGTITTNQATFSWSGSDTDGTISGYYYDLDDSTPDTWTTNTTKTFNNISNGSHNFYVKAKDNDGDLSSTISRSFIVDVEETESFVGYTNNQGEYTFFSENANQNITVIVENENNFPLSGIYIDAVHTSNNLIISARDSDDDYYPSLQVVSASQIDKTFSIKDSRDRPIITIILAAYTIGSTIHWLLTDPPEIELIYNDSNIENVCVTGDIEDLINIFGIISSGFGNLLHIGSEAASVLNLSSTYGSLINASFDEILSELVGSNFNTSADYTYCFFEYNSGESLPLVYVPTAELPPTEGEILFIRGNHLCQVDVDGSNFIQLTDGFGEYYSFPDYNPSLNKIAIEYIAGILNMIAIVDENGQNQLTPISSQDYLAYPRWNHAGDKFVFIDYTSIRIYDYYLQTSSEIISGAKYASFSPDDTKIVYSNLAGEIYTANIDGTNIEQITNYSYSDYPEFSPNGNKIIFENSGDIWIMDSNGNNIYNVTNNTSYYEKYPHWITNYKFIFQKGTDVYTMDIDGTNEEYITWSSSQYASPTWKESN